MELTEFKELREKIQAAKEKRSRAEGVLDQLTVQFKEMSCDGIEDAKKKIVSIKKEIEGDETKLDGFLDKLEKITDWSKV